MTIDTPLDGVAAAVRADLAAVADPARAVQLARYFQSGPGGYGEGDLFLGITVPQARTVARAHADWDVPDADLHAAVRALLASAWHEERLVGLLIMVRRYQLAGAAAALRRDGAPLARARRGELARLYLQVRDGVDNWDLVDQSAHEVLGAWLESEGSLDGEPAADVRARLAGSPRLWDRRIAMISTYASIRVGSYGPTLTTAEALLGDRHDLMHKAVGWMLREVGNRDLPTELRFLDVHSARMPRTALRYAIEKFPEELRQSYLRR